jgi:hypothetical protein
MLDGLFLKLDGDIDLLINRDRCIYNFFNVPQFTSLVSAVTTLVYDLGLSRAISTESLSIYETAMRTGCGTRKIPLRTRTLEEQRALLGCFHLSYV